MLKHITKHTNHFKMKTPLKPQKPEFKWNWFKYAGVRSTSVFTKSGRKIQLRLNDVFGIKEATKSFDLLALPNAGTKIRFPIPDSEKLMSRSRVYRGKVDWPEDAPKPVPATPVHIPASVAKKPAIVLTKPEAGRAKTVVLRPSPVVGLIHGPHSGRTGPQVVTPPRSRQLPLLDLDEDYDDVANLGLDFNSQSGVLIPGGVYVSTSPTSDSVLRLNKLAALVKFLSPEEDFHCTVLYSRNENCVKEVPTPQATTYAATVSAAVQWKGHDDKQYLVLKLDSPQLVELNSSWTRLKYTQDFEPYAPHITLKTGVEAAAAVRALVILNNFIKLHPGMCSIVLDSVTVKPLRD